MARDDDGIAGAKSSLSLVTNLTVAFLVILWLVPTIGLLVSSFRDRDAISQSGWWKAPFATEQNFAVGAEGDFAQQPDGTWTLAGNLFGEGGSGNVSAFGGSRNAPNEFTPGETGELVRGRMLAVEEDGDYLLTYPEEPSRNPTIYFGTSVPPSFSTDNYETILYSNNMDRAFINTLTVTIPATIIPILIAAFAAYALAWMDFPFRGTLIAIVVGLLVVPLQLALVPMLKFHYSIGIGQSFYGIWFAHTGLRAAARDLPAAELHGRPAARHHRERQGRRRDRFPGLHQDRAAAVVPGARLLRDLPVPLDLERPARSPRCSCRPTPNPG